MTKIFLAIIIVAVLVLIAGWMLASVYNWLIPQFVENAKEMPVWVGSTIIVVLNVILKGTVNINNKK